MNEVNGGVVNHADLFHTGIVVDDLAAAKEELGAALGVTWRDGGAEVRLTDRRPARAPCRPPTPCRPSGPHHVELVQSIPGTVWSVTAPGHAHHLGYWVDDVPSAAAELVRPRGGAGRQRRDEGRPAADVHLPPITNGLYLEIVDRRMRPVLLPDP